MHHHCFRGCCRAPVPTQLPACPRPGLPPTQASAGANKLKAEGTGSSTGSLVTKGPAPGEPAIQRVWLLRLRGTAVTLRLFSQCGPRASSTWSTVIYVSRADLQAVHADAAARAAWTSLLERMAQHTDAAKAAVAAALNGAEQQVRTLDGVRPLGARWVTDDSSAA